MNRRAPYRSGRRSPAGQVLSSRRTAAQRVITVVAVAVSVGMRDGSGTPLRAAHPDPVERWFRRRPARRSFGAPAAYRPGPRRPPTRNNHAPIELTVPGSTSWADLNDPRVQPVPPAHRPVVSG
ncbi:hypothetical protein GCM10017776_10810 [Streptomyces griseoluteus]|nr:hypothetical protein GCM10017776_10810 [Streptomyces griseoluteus]